MLRKRQFRYWAAAVATLAIMTVTGHARAAVVGNPLVNGGIDANNTSAGNDYVLDQALPVGETVSTWGVYSDAAGVVGNSATPFLATMTGTVLNAASENVPVFEIIAVGTTRSIDASGEQTWAFDVVAGSDVIGANTYFGWRDGGALETEKGGSVAEYSNGLTSPDVRTWFTHGSSLTGNPVAIGTEVPTRTSHSIAILFDRTYSAHVNTVPEPASLALIGLGAVAMLRRRR